MPCHSEIGQSKSPFLLTVALLCFQAKKLPFSHGNGHSDWLTEWLFLYNYRIIYRLANTKYLRFSTLWCIIILCNAANSSLDRSWFVISDLEQLNCCNLPLSVSCRQVWAKLCFRKRAIKMLLSNERPIIALGL